MLSAALTFSVYAQKISLFNTIQSGDFRTRTASLRGGSPHFRRPASDKQKLPLSTPIVKNLSCQKVSIPATLKAAAI